MLVSFSPHQTKFLHALLCPLHLLLVCPPRAPLSVAKALAPAPPPSVLGGGAEVTRLMVVRHPFHRSPCHNPLEGPPTPRLVSAFRDKLERCHSVRRGRCDLHKDYYYNKSAGNGLMCAPSGMGAIYGPSSALPT